MKSRTTHAMNYVKHLIRMEPKMNRFAISHMNVKTFAALLMVSLGPAAAPAMAAPGFNYGITDSGQTQADPVLKQNFTVVKFGSLTKQRPKPNFSTDIVSLKTPQNVEVVSLASSPADGADCPAEGNCRQEHSLTLNAFACSLKGDYVATFNQWVWDDTKGRNVSQQVPVNFKLGGGGECAPGETRKTLAELKAAVNAAAAAAAAAEAEAKKRAMLANLPPLQPTRIVQLKAFGRDDRCLKENADGAITFGYCNTLGSQWRHHDNQLLSTTGGRDARCLILVYNAITGTSSVSLDKDCTTSHRGNVPRSIATWTLEEKGRAAKLVSADAGGTEYEPFPVCIEPTDDTGPTWRYCHKTNYAWTVETLLAKPAYVSLQHPAVLWSGENNCVVADVARNADLSNPTPLKVLSGKSLCNFNTEVPVKYFQREDMGDGFFRLRYAASSLCVAAAGNAENSKVLLQPCSNEAGQKWQQDGKRLKSAVVPPSGMTTDSAVFPVLDIGGDDVKRNSSLCLNSQSSLGFSIVRCTDAVSQYFSVATDYHEVYVQESPATLYAPKQTSQQASEQTSKQASKSSSPSTISNGKWVKLPGSAMDIGMGGGVLWVIGTKPVSGGYELLRWNGTNFVSMPGMNGGGVRLDVDPKGNPWVVTSSGQVLRWTGSGWQDTRAENAQDIGIGANGAVWYVGGAKAPGGGYNIAYWNTEKWLPPVSAAAIRIDVDPQGAPWVIGSAGQIARWTGSTWAFLTGSASDISIGADGSVFVVGAADNKVYKWTGTTWAIHDGRPFMNLTVSDKGVPFGVDGSKDIWIENP